MKKEVLDLFDEIFETHQEYEGTVIENHIQKLRELDVYLPPMNSFFIVTNTTKQNYEFVSKNFEYSLGLDRAKMKTEGATYWLSHIHPEDLPIWMSVLEEMMVFTMTKVPLEDRDKLSYTWNFRARDVYGEYHNLLEHQTPTYFDEQGKPIIGIAHSSIVGKGEVKPIIGVVKKLNSNNEYETLMYKNFSQKLLLPLTHRELDVIRLLSLNNTSKQIGEKLFISTQTVQTHRKNILRKMDFHSTQELVQYCIVNQLL